MTELGVFFWYSLPGEMRSLEQVRRVWRQNGLDVDLLPKSRKPADVAAEACSVVDRGISGPSFTQIENSKDALVYLTTSLGAGHEVRFVKATGEFVCLDDELLRQVRDIYEYNGTRLPPHKQRRSLTDYLLAAGAENLHGSIYFMPAVGEAISHLQSAWAMVDALYDENAEFHMIPVQAEQSQLEYVGRSVDRVLTSEIEGLTQEVAAMLEKEPHRKWRSDRIDAIVNRQRALEARGDRFAELLAQAPPAAFAAARVMDDTIAELLRHVEIPEIT